MKSLTQSVALLNSMTKVPSTDTTTTALLTQLWNDSVRTVCSIRSGKWHFLMTEKTLATVASQSAYAIPASLRKMVNVTVTVGTTKYLPQPVFSPEAWNAILAANLGESDTPRFYFIQNGKIHFAPTPATDGNTITIVGRKNIPDLVTADATVTVTAVANGGTAVTTTNGALASMAGKYIRIAQSSTGAAGVGDGQWYEIASATPTTTITLAKPYEGTTLAAATAAATVAAMTPIPEAYDMAPIYRSLALFYQINDPLHPAVYQTYWRLYDGGQEAGLSPLVGGLVGQMLENEGESIEGAYIPPSLSGNLLDTPYYDPRDQASGF